MEWLEEQQKGSIGTAAAAAVGEDGDNDGNNKKKRMLGAEATVHIQQELSSKQPNKVISEFQKYHSLDPLFKKRRTTAAAAVVTVDGAPTGGQGGDDVELWGLLGMLELMGLTKADVNLSLLACLRNSLLFQIESNLPTHKLYELLEGTFKWINFDELRPLVMAIMKKLPSLSITYLKQLSTTPPPSFFPELPIEVKRQIWLLDDSFLTAHFLPLVRQYLTFYSASSTTTTMAAATSSSASLSLSATLSSSSSLLLSPGHHSNHQLVSSSSSVDSAIVSPSSPPASPPHSPTTTLAPVISTPSIHDITHAITFTFPSMLSPDPLHTPTPQKRREKNAALQEIVKAIGREVDIYHKFLKLIKSSAFNDLENQNPQQHNQRICTLRTDVLMALHDAGISEIYEKDECHEFGWVMDACVRDNNVELRRIKEMQSFFEHISSSSSMLLTDLSMIVADPYATNTLIRNIYSTLQQVVRKEIIPKDDEGLRYMTQLLALSYEAPSSSSQQNKKQKTKFFKVSKSQKEILHLFYPLLASRILDHETSPKEASATTDDGGSIPPIEQSLRDLFHNNVTARKVILYYTLVRLQALDFSTAELFLPLIFELKETLLEESSFTQSLLLLLISIVTTTTSTTSTAVGLPSTTAPTVSSISSQQQNIRQMILDNLVPLNGHSPELHLQLIQFVAASHTRFSTQQLFSLLQKLVGGAQQLYSNSKLLPDYDQKRLDIAYRYLVDRLSSRVNERNAPFLFDFLSSSRVSSAPVVSTDAV